MNLTWFDVAFINIISWLYFFPTIVMIFYKCKSNLKDFIILNIFCFVPIFGFPVLWFFLLVNAYSKNRDCWINNFHI